MIDVLQRATLFVLYQVSIAAAIALLPIALLAQRGGVTIPLDRIVDRLGRAYRNAS